MLLSLELTMKLASRILAALDGSPRAPDVLHMADRLAKRTPAALEALRVIGIPRELPQEVLRMSPAEVEKELVEQAKAGLKNMCEESGIIADVHVREGVPWDAICREAKSDKDDLIVMGSHGYRGLDRILGTTASRVVNHAPCSVLVARGAWPDSGIIRKILVGLDESERAEGVLRGAVGLARAAGPDEPAKLITATIVQIPEHVGRMEDDARPVLESLTDEAGRSLHALSAMAPEGMVEERIVTKGQPWRTLLELATKHSVDAIVIGTHGYSGLDHLIGTNAARVANRAEVSVLVVREPEAAT